MNTDTPIMLTVARNAWAMNAVVRVTNRLTVNMLKITCSNRLVRLCSRSMSSTISRLYSKHSIRAATSSSGST